ncbi:condensation domain-containing protein [Streptomyces sp. NPDC006879]|uniref:phthiocerol/phthiodiolone dimycocerosyl transferase family protein n=1 Tax=Streptomyces sp. NPDC006879 TaxID=3364767 RepID=UPI003678AEF6
MHRTLCPAESIYVAQRSRAVLSCTVRGPLDEELLAEAFAAKLAEHPSLRCRIAQRDGVHVLEPLAEEDLPRLLIREGGPHSYAEEFNSPLPVGGPLVRATLWRGSATAHEHLMMLSVDHTVTDGHSAIALLRGLWDTYTELSKGQATDAARQTSYPVPVSALLPPVAAEGSAEYLTRRIEQARRRPVACLPYEATGADRGPSGREISVIRVLLEADQTERLLQLAKSEGISVHGMVAAAMLLAVRRRMDTAPEARSLGCLSPVDLRSRLAPPLAKEMMVPAVTSCVDVLEVAPDGDSLELAREVTRNLHAALDRGDFLHEMQILGAVPKHPELLATSVIVTNMGRVEGPVAPPGLDIDDVRLAPAREHYFPQAGRGPVMACVVSFDGRLGVELPYSTECFTEAQMNEVADSLCSVLLGFAQGEGVEGCVAVPA